MTRASTVSRVAIVLLACATLGGGCGDGSEDTEGMCRAELPFAPTYLPTGVSATPVAGPGGDTKVAEVAGVTVMHFPGPPTTFIDVFRGGSRHSIATTQRITVLGGAGEIGAIEGGYGVDFTHGTAVLCNRYHIEAFGLPETEVRAFAEGLEPR